MVCLNVAKENSSLTTESLRKLLKIMCVYDCGITGLRKLNGKWFLDLVQRALLKWQLLVSSRTESPSESNFIYCGFFQGSHSCLILGST